MESQFDVVIEDLFNASIKLEEKEKVRLHRFVLSYRRTAAWGSDLALRVLRVRFSLSRCTSCSISLSIVFYNTVQLYCKRRQIIIIDSAFPIKSDARFGSQIRQVEKVDSEQGFRIHNFNFLFWGG